jgi:hypothetical protein
MMLRVFMHSRSKRAETITLLDSGATENFMSLEYAKYLHLPIKMLPQLRKLFNMDGTRNRAGDLKYYIDLNMRTGSKKHEPTILPHGPRRPQSDLRIPMVRHRATKN